MHTLKVMPPKSVSRPADPAGPSNPIQIRALTGLRFVAALLVFVHHLDGHFGYSGYHLPLANTAVTFFFVLSGFILTIVYGEKLDQNRGQRISAILPYLKKRVARIWPLHVVCLLLCVATVRYLNTDIDKVVTNLFLVHAWFPNSLYVFSLNNVSWSISTELFFYAAFPLLVMRGFRGFLWRYAVLICVTIAGLVLLNYLFVIQWGDRNWLRLMVHANPLMRFWEFSTGVLAGYLFTRSKGVSGRGGVVDTLFEIVALGVIVGWWTIVFHYSLIAQVSTIPGVGESLSTWIWFSSAAPFCAFGVWIMARSRGLFARWLSGPVMVHLGEISFAFYMTHMLVIRVITVESDPTVITGPLAIAMTLGGALALSQLMYKLVELPGKESMLALLNGQPGEAAQRLWGGIRSGRPCHKTALAMVALVIVGAVVHFNSLAKYQQSRVGVIVQESRQMHQQVCFGEAATLNGCLVTVEDQEVVLELAWTAQEIRSKQRRTIRLLNRQGETLATDKIRWFLHLASSPSSAPATPTSSLVPHVTHERLAFDRARFPDLHKIFLSWEDGNGQRAALSKNGQRARLKQLELFCQDPADAYLDIFAQPPGKTRDLIEKMMTEGGSIPFGDHATLCGYECVRLPDGNLEINFVWRLEPGLTDRRVLNFLDRDGLIVGNYGDVTLFQFVRKMKGQASTLYLDRIVVGPEKYNDASVVTLGMWSPPSRSMVKIKKGDTIHAGQRLVVGKIDLPGQSGQ